MPEYASHQKELTRLAHIITDKLIENHQDQPFKRLHPIDTTRLQQLADFFYDITGNHNLPERSTLIQKCVDFLKRKLQLTQAQWLLVAEHLSNKRKQDFSWYEERCFASLPPHFIFPQLPGGNRDWMAEFYLEEMKRCVAIIDRKPHRYLFDQLLLIARSLPPDKRPFIADKVKTILQYMPKTSLEKLLAWIDVDGAAFQKALAQINRHLNDIAKLSQLIAFHLHKTLHFSQYVNMMFEQLNPQIIEEIS